MDLKNVKCFMYYTTDTKQFVQMKHYSYRLRFGSLQDNKILTLLHLSEIT